MVYLELDSMVEDVREAEKKAVQVTELITMFESKVSEEEEVIDRLYETAQQAHQYLEGAQTQLKKADDKASNSMFRYFLAYLFLFASFLLMGLHAINS
jgi:t-SNARE complex subunit (syntaxin)